MERRSLPILWIIQGPPVIVGAVRDTRRIKVLDFDPAACRIAFRDGKNLGFRHSGLGWAISRVPAVLRRLGPATEANCQRDRKDKYVRYRIGVTFHRGSSVSA